MSETEATPAPKRRQRRTPPKEALAAALVAEEAPDGEVTSVPTDPDPEPDPQPEKRPALPHDERIGLEVDPRATQVGFDDGRTYRCEHGRIVERVA